MYLMLVIRDCRLAVTVLRQVIEGDRRGISSEIPLIASWEKLSGPGIARCRWKFVQVIFCGVKRSLIPNDGLGRGVALLARR